MQWTVYGEQALYGSVAQELQGAPAPPSGTQAAPLLLPPASPLLEPLLLPLASPLLEPLLLPLAPLEPPLLLLVPLLLAVESSPPSVPLLGEPFELESQAIASAPPASAMTATALSL